MIEAFIDTSYAVALANTKDRHHSLAVELSFLLEGTRLITTECILLEIGNSLARGLRKEAVAIISNFLKSKEIEVVHLDDSLLVRAIDLYESRDDKT